jgi:hypothetical protein
MKTKGKTLTGIVSLLFVLAIGFYFGIIVKNTKNYDWKEFTIDPSGKGYGFTSEALFNSDIRIPDIKKLSGKGKFIKARQATSDDLFLGYIVSVDIDKLDLTKIPQKYKIEKEEQYKAGDFTVLPIEYAVYEISFEYSLKDKDGFELMKLKSPSHSLFTGKVNSFQDIVKQAVAGPIANRVANIGLYMTFEKCETCRDQ